MGCYTIHYSNNLVRIWAVYIHSSGTRGFLNEYTFPSLTSAILLVEAETIAWSAEAVVGAESVLAFLVTSMVRQFAFIDI